MSIAQWLRDRGFSAYPGIAIGGAVDHVRLAERANLGAIGDHGLLIAPQCGARLRINVVYTHIVNLPLPERNDHAWVRDFCAKCRKCIRTCPAQAIHDPSPLEASDRQSVLDHRRCADYMASNYTCGVCLSICPFSRAGYSRIEAGFAGHRRLTPD